MSAVSWTGGGTELLLYAEPRQRLQHFSRYRDVPHALAAVD